MSGATLRAKLPPITERQALHQGCCLSLSTEIIQKIAVVLPSKPSLILSIGSGTGLLEVLLIENHPNLRIEGVEVNANVNKFLPLENFHVVKGTWDLCMVASHAQVLMFVYPRSQDLLRKYLKQYGSSGNVHQVVWIGPTVDWDTFKETFDATGLEIVQPTPLSPFETMVIARPSP
jgi:hypothetical protein